VRTAHQRQENQRKRDDGAALDVCIIPEGAALPLWLTRLGTGSSHFVPTFARRGRSRKEEAEEGEEDEGRRVRTRRL